MTSILSTIRRAGVVAGAVALLAAALSGCTNAVSPGGAPQKSADPARASIGLLLPDAVATRYEAADRPDFTAEVGKLCPHCTVLYQNAFADASKQQAQAESMLSQGVQVLVLDAVDGEAAVSIVHDAVSKNVPVIAYDRLIDSSNLSYYLSFDNRRVGVLQGTALVDKLEANKVPKGEGVLMINGSPTDDNARQYKAGAHSVIDSSGYRVLAEYDAPTWAGSEAQAWTAGQLTQFGDRIAGVYAANDSLAQGAIAAMQGAGMTSIPPVTGQDAELAAIQRILAGTQYMTVYKAMKPEAQKAAQLAIDLVNGRHPKATTSVRVKSGGSVPSFMLTPISVTAQTVERTVVADGFYSAAQICTPSYAAACTKYGIR